MQYRLKHLGHNDYTDIITFPYEEDPITGEIFISIDRVKDNAKSFKTTFENELRRVMIHGILHLCGYDDHSKADIKKIREKEELYLSKWWSVIANRKVSKQFAVFSFQFSKFYSESWKNGQWLLHVRG